MTILECEQTPDGDGSNDFFITTDRGEFLIKAFISFNPSDGWRLDNDYYFDHEEGVNTEIHSMDKIEEIRYALLFWAENNLEPQDYEEEEETKQEFYD